MGRDLNQVQILGNVGQDVDIKRFDNGGMIANFSVATTESWKDKASGEWKDDTTWHRVVVKNTFMVEKAERVIRKGERVLVQGQVKSRKYTGSDGVEKTMTEIVIPPFGMGMLEVQPNSKGGGSDFAPTVQTDSPSDVSPFDLDDEIPFNQ
jgi:single-strand DNA-binding protein|tara:strand:+ start:4878 stop:5330 length:453 start_codon:yes stop_codon:yes gene_type:complete